MTHLIDVANGNTNTKIISLLSILREQLNRIEERLNRLEQFEQDRFQEEGEEDLCSCRDGEIDIYCRECF